MRRTALLIAMVVLFGTARLAHAHAFLERANPAVGSTVHGSPHELVLHFSEELEAAFSTVHVEDSQGRPVAAGRAHVDAYDTSVLEVSLPSLPPGRYHVSWRVVSVDTHVTEGAYAFDVLP
ncbi:MAG TPA: copper resistance protein CopC [Casimicrobiaceae bacterium]|jgi:methionine-rich copper-binding protein CopC